MALDARERLARDLLHRTYEDLTPVQRSVVDLIATEAPSELHPDLQHDERRPTERLADRVAAVGGSWGFIIGFGVALAMWMGWNVATRGFGLSFDPYPFIFLNLVLSTLAAVQAPIIMMSQNRAAARDRKSAEHDYLVNLRAELEIMHLHDKVDAVRKRELLGIIRRQNESLRILREQGPDVRSGEVAPGSPSGAHARQRSRAQSSLHPGPERSAAMPAAAGRTPAGTPGASVPDPRSPQPRPRGR